MRLTHSLHTPSQIGTFTGNCIRDSGAEALAKILEPRETSGGNSASCSKLEYIDLSGETQLRLQQRLLFIS